MRVNGKWQCLATKHQYRRRRRHANACPPQGSVNAVASRFAHFLILLTVREVSWDFRDAASARSVTPTCQANKS